MQDYESLSAAVMICATLIEIQTHRHAMSERVASTRHTIIMMMMMMKLPILPHAEKLES